MSDFPEPQAQASAEAQADASVELWLRRANWTAAFTVFLVIGGVVGFNLSQSLGKARKPKCGVDWLLAACGSDETFESMIQGAIVDSDKQLKEQHPELFETQFDFSEPMLLTPIDLKGFNGFDPSVIDR